MFGIVVGSSFFITFKNCTVTKRIVISVKSVYIKVIQGIKGDCFVRTPVTVNCIHTISNKRVVVSAASYGTNVRNVCIVRIDCHKPCYSAFNRKLINYVRFVNAILRKRSLYIAYHNGNRSFSDGVFIETVFACKGIFFIAEYIRIFVRL